MVNRLDSEAYRPWLHRFAVIYVIMTFVVVVSGGNVTSRDAGLAVPEGFRVYGYFLWSFPIERWVGNILHEHLHRLLGSVLGMLAILMAIWLMMTPRRGLRLAGLVTLLMVLVQGLLGAWRVNAVSTFYAVLHGMHAQLVLCMTVIIAAATVRHWSERSGAKPSLSALSILLLLSLLVQLALGTAMRHTGSGLAIPDFPTSYGRWLPPLGQQAIADATDAWYVSDDYDARPPNYAAPAQVAIHFAHRAWAVAVLLVAVLLIGRIAASPRPDLVRPAIALITMLCAQVGLGIGVIWTGRHPQIATGHQALGAAILATATLLSFRIVSRRAKPMTADQMTTPNTPATGRTAACP